MKLNDLIFNREKLRKYDELKEWRDFFGKDGLYLSSEYETFGENEALAVFIPDHIKQIILSALDAEIKKLDEE